MLNLESFKRSFATPNIFFFCILFKFLFLILKGLGGQRKFVNSFKNFVPFPYVPRMFRGQLYSQGKMLEYEMKWISIKFDHIKAFF